MGSISSSTGSVLRVGGLRHGSQRLKVRPAGLGRRLTGLFTSLLLVAGVTVATTVVAAPSAAAAGIQVPFSTAYQTQDNGAIAIIGNSQMTCGTAAITQTATCAQVRQIAPATSGSNSIYNNNGWNMVFIDQDSDSTTTNSTSADLSLPAGSIVLFAQLVWGGRRGYTGTVTTTTAAAQVRFKVPGASAYSTVTGTLNNSGLNNSTDANPYQTYLDVTSQVKAAGNGTYWIGNIGAQAGVADRYAGWSLIVAYRNPSAPLRDLRVYRGFATVDTTGASASIDIPIQGFLTPTSGTVSAAVGFVAWEGDRGTVGDSMQFGGRVNAGGTATSVGTTLTDATRPSNNFFDSAITDSGTAITARAPNYPNTLGVDMGRVNATNVLSNGQTATYVRLTTTGDTYYPTVITTQIDLFTPAFNPTSKTVVNLSGNSPAKVGDTLRYQISLTNTGSDAADSSVITDELPPDTTYVPGSLVLETNPGSTPSLNLTDATGDDQAEYLAVSRTVRFRVGQGASATAGGVIGVNQTVTVRFRVTVDRDGAGTTISNISQLDYVAHTIAKPFTYVGNQVDTPVAEIADLAVAKTSNPTTQNAGANVTYRITATNNGPNAATNVVLTDTLPTGATLVSSTPPAGVTCSNSGQVVTCRAATLANGGSIVVPIVAAIAPGTGAGTQLTDVAAVSSDIGDDVSTNNTANATTTVTRSADVRLTKSAAPTTVNAGSNVTYTLTATNGGPSSATNVVLTDPLPLGLTFVSASPSSASCVNDNSTVTCSLGTLAPNQSVPVTIVAAVNSNVSAGTITNTATVKSSTADPNGDNNTATTPITVATSADLTVTKTASAASVVAGNLVTYTIAVKNNGPSDAQAVTVSDPSVTGLTILSAATTQGTCTVAANDVGCTLGVVGAGTTVTVTVQARVGPGRAAGPLSNTASATSSTTDPNPADNSSNATITVTSSADLALIKSASPAMIVPGQNVTYTLNVSNAGPSNASSVVVTDTLPDGLTFVSSASGCTAVGQVVTCTTATVTNGGNQNLTFVAAAADTATGTITNTATVTAATPDPNTSNNTASAVSSSQPQADMSIVKSGTPTQVAGQTVSYTLIVRNNGPSAASAVNVSDPAPAGVTFTGASVTGGGGLICSVQAGGVGVSCAATMLTSGQSRTVTITGTLAGSAQGSVTNTATVSSTTADPTPGNNSSSAITQVTTLADVAVTLTAPSEAVYAGTTVPLSLMVRNNGPSTARDVVVTGQVPPGLVPVLGSSQGACTYDAGTGTVTCSLGDIPPGVALPTIPLQARVVSSQQPGTINATATVGSTTADSNSANNTSTVPILVITRADLSITKRVSPDPLVAGGQAAYTLTVGNAGDSDARTVVVSDTLPATLTISSANPTLGSCDVAGQQVRCTIPTVPANSTATVTILVSVDPAASGTITNTGSVSSATTDPDPDNNTAVVSTDVIETAHLTLSKTASPDPIVAGSAVTYTLTLVNHGPSDAHDVVLDDPLPHGFAVLTNGVTAPGNSCPTAAGATSVHCDFGTVDPGGTRVIQIRASTAADLAAGATVTNTATLTTSTDDSDPSGHTATATTGVATSADLQIAKVPTIDPIEAGDNQTYVIQVTNNGPSISRDVVVTDPIPAGTRFVSVVPSTGCDATGGTLTCRLGDLGRSEATTLQVTVALDPGIGGTALTNTATVRSAPTTGAATPDPNTANNSSSASQLVATRSDLVLHKEITSGPIIAGQSITYQITATNNGPSDTTTMVITDPIPDGTTLVSAKSSDDGTCQLTTPLTCSWPAVDLGQTRTATVIVAVPASAQVGSIITNTATVDSDNVNTTPDQSTATAAGPVTTSADISAVKTLLSGNPVAGGTATWQIVVHNAGPSQATNVTVADVAPAGVTFTATTPTPACALPGGDLSCALGVIDSGRSTTVTVTGTLAAGFTGQLSNTAVADSDTPDPNTGNNTSTLVKDTSTSADLSLAKTADAAAFVAGQPAGWTVRVSNSGPSVARAAVVTDVVPAGITGVGASVGGQSCTTAPGTGANAGSTVVTCPVGDVVPGTPVIVAVTGTIDPSMVAPNVGNTAAVSSNTPDPDPNDNRGTSTTPVTTSADLSLSKTGPTTVNAGQAITWTLTVHNAGPSDAQGAASPTPCRWVSPRSPGPARAEGVRCPGRP